MIDIGRIAHQAYLNRSETNCICVDRCWEDLTQEEQGAWRAAACAVAQYLDQEKIQYEKDKESFE
jgi:hypothetical protein